MRLQVAFSQILDALDPPAAKPPHIARLLGLDKSLAWKVYRLVNEAVPHQIAQFVPGRSGMNIFIQACRNSRVPEDKVVYLEHAAEEYSTLVRVHGGDRASVELMLSGSGEPDRTQMTLRRAAFRAASFVAGIQARTHLQSFFICKSRTPGMLDVALVKAFVEIRRLRSNAPFVLLRPVVTDDKGGLLARPNFEPIEPFGQSGPGVAGEVVSELEPAAQVGLMREYSSLPTPKFSMGRITGTHQEFELADSPVGNTGALTCVCGEILRAAVSATAFAGNMNAEHAIQLRTPCQAALLDVFVQRGVFPAHTPKVAVYSEYSGNEFRRGNDRDRYRLPGSFHAELLGSGSNAAITSDMPRYASLAQRVFERLGVDGSEFDLYRSRIAYPFIPCAMVMTHPLHAAEK